MDLNAWLLQNGYLALKDGAAGDESYLKDIDWSRTRAYTFGLAGVYINQKGREAQGIVEPGEAACAEARTRRASSPDCATKQRDRLAIRNAWPSDSLYSGPYLDAAPDLIVGYADGYRASWDAAVGKVTAQRVQRQRKGVERRSLRRSRTWFRACCSPTARSTRRTPGSKTWRPPLSICSASSRRPIWKASLCSSRNGVPLDHEAAA